MRKSALYLGICLLIAVFSVAIVGGCSSKEKVDTEMGVSAVVALTEAHVEGLVTSMQVMALTDEVKSADWAEMGPLLAEFEYDSIPLVAWFALPDASYYTVDAGLASGNLSDREYFPKVMDGEIVIGDLVVSKSTGKESTVVTVPVNDGSEVVGALGASIYLDDLSHLIAEDLGLPDDMVFYAVNADDVIALHSDTDMIMKDASEQPALSDVESATSSLLGWTFYFGYE
jgi:outer membrane murein-binding lipoprotein Lpp